MRQHFKRYAANAIILIAGILIGFLVWNLINLPYHNPYNVVGVLSDLHFNPNTNVARYLVFLCVPVFVLLFVYWFSRKRASWLFGPNENAALIDDSKEFTSSNKVYILLIFGILILTSHYRYLDNPAGAASPPMMDHFHNGEATAAAVAYENGLVPYRDFYVARGIIQDPLKVLASFELFGRAQSSVRVFESIQRILTYGALGVLFILFFRRNYLASAFIASIFYLLPVIGYLTPSRLWERDLLFFLFLIALLLIQRGVKRENEPYAPTSPGLVYAGAFTLCFLAPVGFAYSLDRGFFLTAVLILVWPLLFFITLRQSRLRPGFFIASLSGFAIGFLVLGFTLKWAYGDMFRFAFIQLPGYKEFVDGLEFGISGYSLKANLYRMYILVLHAAAVFWLAYKYLQHINQEAAGFWLSTQTFIRKYLFEIAFLLLSIASFRYALGRADRDHIATAGAYNILFLLYIAVKYYLPQITGSRKLRRVLISGMTVILVVVTSVNVYRLITRDVLFHAYPFGRTDTEMLTPDYRELTAYLKPLVSEEAQFVTLTNEASLYYLLDEPCPLKFAEIWFGTTDYFQLEMVKQLESKPVRYILYTNDAVWNEIDGVNNKRRAPIIFDYVDRNFQPYHRIGSHDIWIRKTDIPVDGK
ncbi:hypothetical protein KKH18_05270 [bacterium]|nr:hypothetical protein [bacterium]